MTDAAVTTTETPNAAPEAPAAAPAAQPSQPAAPAAAPKQSSASPSTPAGAAPQKPVERSSVIREAMIAKGIIKPRVDAPAATGVNSGQQPRDERGKFASPLTAPLATTPAPSAASPQVTNLPRSLRKEYEAAWKAAHPDLQKAWTQRDADYDRGITQYRTQAQQAEAILSAIKPYEHVLRATNTDARQTIANLMPIAAVLATGTPQQKAHVIMQAMGQYGLSLEHLQAFAQGQQQSGSPMMDPNVQALARQVQELTQAWQGTQHRNQAAEDARVNAIAESFGRDKPNFDGMRPQMWSVLQAQAQAEANGISGPFGSAAETAAWPEQKWIEEAYNAALRLDPNSYQAEIARAAAAAQTQERDRATQAAMASRAASVQVRGAPSGPTSLSAVDPKDRRAVIAAAIRSRVN